MRTSNLVAFPSSINELPGVSGDVRTVDKLIDGVFDSTDDRHMWLCPWSPGQARVFGCPHSHLLTAAQVNVLHVVFDAPVTMAGVRFWNYAKTPARGVHDYQILIDDRCVLHPHAPTASTSLWQSGVWWVAAFVRRHSSPQPAADRALHRRRAHCGPRARVHLHLSRSRGPFHNTLAASVLTRGQAVLLINENAVVSGSERQSTPAQRAASAAGLRPKTRLVTRTC